MQARLAGDRRIAEREVERLLNLDPAERRETVERAYKRYRTPAFVERMIEQARVFLPHDHHESLALLAVAERQVPRISRHVYGHALIQRLSLRLLAHQANAHRVAGDLRAAEARFAEIPPLPSPESPDDCALQGELASLEASLRYDQRRLRRADALLERAERLYQRTGDAIGLLKVLIQRGSILYCGGQPERAIPHYEAANAAVDADADPALALDARHNLVLCLCSVGHSQAARDLLEATRGLYQRVGDATSVNQLLWIEGTVAAALGEDRRALERLRSARDGYTERGLDFDAALVSLDLAEVHLGRGETAEVQHIARRMAHTFSERGVGREAFRAIAMFHEAARAERVTLELIARTRSALLRLSRRPRRRPA